MKEINKAPGASIGANSLELQVSLRLIFTTLYMCQMSITLLPICSRIICDPGLLARYNLLPLYLYV